MDYNYTHINDITAWRQSAITELRLNYENNNHQTIYIKNFDESSTWKLTPILRKDDKGGDRTVAFRFEGTFVLIQTDYDNMLDLYRLITKEKVAWVQFKLGYADGVSHNENIYIGMYNYVEMKQHTTITFNLEQDKLSPKMTINISGLCPIDFIDDEFIQVRDKI